MVAEWGAPIRIRDDDGPEFVGRSLDLWADFNGVTLEFNRSGTPACDPDIEAFNGPLRPE
jgi:putative transposase